MNFDLDEIDVDHRVLYIALLVGAFAAMGAAVYVWGIPFTGSDGPKSLKKAKQKMKEDAKKQTPDQQAGEADQQDDQEAGGGSDEASDESEDTSGSSGSSFLENVNQTTNEASQDNEDDTGSADQQPENGLMQYIQKAQQNSEEDSDQPNVTVERTPRQDLLQRFDDLNEQIALYKKRVELAKLKKQLQDSRGDDDQSAARKAAPAKAKKSSKASKAQKIKQALQKAKAKKKKKVGRGVMLLGLFTTGDRRQAMVMYRKRRHTLHEGDRIGKATVKSITSEHMVLSRDGETRTLEPRVLPPQTDDEDE